MENDEKWSRHWWKMMKSGQSIDRISPESRAWPFRPIESIMFSTQAVYNSMKQHETAWNSINQHNTAYNSIQRAWKPTSCEPSSSGCVDFVVPSTLTRSRTGPTFSGSSAFRSWTAIISVPPANDEPPPPAAKTVGRAGLKSRSDNQAKSVEGQSANSRRTAEGQSKSSRTIVEE